MQLQLNDSEIELLRTRHGNCYVVRAIRKRLADAGFKWCPICSRALSVSSFAPNGTTLQMACRSCKPAKRDYAHIGDTAPDRTARYSAAHPVRVRRRKLAAYLTRRSVGMSGRQAAYLTPWDEYRDAWDSLRTQGTQT